MKSRCCSRQEQKLKLKGQMMEQLHSMQASTSINIFSLINNYYFYKAAEEGHVYAIAVLLKAGANIEQGNKNNATALFKGTNLN